MKLPRFHVSLVRRLLLLAWLLHVPTLRADETVRQVQEELRKRNLYFGDIDGRATPEVAAALRRYQSHKGFAATGALDETTLRSLIDETTLRTLNPRLAGLVPASAEVPPLNGWPDITVLRSDEARRNSAPAAHSGADDDSPAATPAPLVAATPIPGPPPAAASRQRPGLDEVRAFLARYLQAGQTNDVPGELAFYADRVDFFNEGVVERHFIENDSARYDKRWPQRHFTLLDPLTLSDAPDGDPDKVVAHFRYAFANKGPRYTVEGKADNTFTIQHTGPGNFRIVSMKEERVREKQPPPHAPPEP